MSFGIPTRNGLSLGLGAVPTLATNFGLPIPSLSLDYTIPSDGTPGVVPGFYQVDNGFGVLTQTTFSSLITFSRSSNATRIGPDGLVQYAPHNLVTYSQQFDNAAWIKNSTTISSNAITAPDGTVTADKLIEANANDNHYTVNIITAVNGTRYTTSVYLKMAERRYAILDMTDALTGGVYVYVDLQTGVITQAATAAGSWTGASASISDAGNGWYRVSVTGTLGANNTAAPIICISNSPTGGELISYTGDGTSGIYIWGAQLSVGTRALDYTPTTSAAVYGPRFDYDPVTLAAKGLLIEEQRTNLVTYSEQFDNAVWTKTRSSITSNTVVAPDGTLTGDALITDTTVTDTHRIELLSVAFTSGTTYTLTLFAKAQSSLNLQLVFLTAAFGISLRAAFNLQTGQTLVSSSSITAKTTNVGNGWFRCEATATATATATSGFHISLINTFAATAAATSFTGDGTSGIYIWGAQLEAGAFATSYIPTTTAATTRSADIASIGTLSPWYNSVEMTVYTEYDIIGKTTTSGFATEIDDGTLNNRIINIGQEIGVGDVKLGSFMNSGGSTSVNDYPITAMNVGSVYKLAFAVKSNDAATVANGISVLDATAVIPSGLTTLRLGRRITDRYLNGHLRRITYTPRRLTNAELQSLTS